MTPVEQIELILPNGLHDALLLGLAIDYKDREVLLRLNVVVNDEREPEYREGVLRITGVQFAAVDSPGPNAVSKSSPSRIDTVGSEPATGLPSLCPGYFLQCFFVNDWNSFIRIAAKAAEFRWADDPDSVGRREGGDEAL